MSASWRLTTTLHVIPAEDIQDHEESPLCWCKPKYVDEGIFVHRVFSEKYPAHEREAQWE